MRRILVDGEAGALRGDLEQHAAGFLEVHRLEPEAIDDVGRAAAGGFDLAANGTNVCVEDTVRDASASGLRVILVADACAAMRDQDHNATLHVVYRSYGDVRSTEEVLGLIVSGRSR